MVRGHLARIKLPLEGGAAGGGWAWGAGGRRGRQGDGDAGVAGVERGGVEVAVGGGGGVVGVRPGVVAVVDGDGNKGRRDDVHPAGAATAGCQRQRR